MVAEKVSSDFDLEACERSIDYAETIAMTTKGIAPRVPTGNRLRRRIRTCRRIATIGPRHLIDRDFGPDVAFDANPISRGIEHSRRQFSGYRVVARRGVGAGATWLELCFPDSSETNGMCLRCKQTLCLLGCLCAPCA